MDINTFNIIKQNRFELLNFLKKAHPGFGEPPVDSIEKLNIKINTDLKKGNKKEEKYRNEVLNIIKENKRAISDILKLDKEGEKLNSTQAIAIEKTFLKTDINNIEITLSESY